LLDVAKCIAVKRINVSAAYFLSIEFQQLNSELLASNCISTREDDPGHAKNTNGIPARSC